jgi:hypothetical protein
MSRPPSSCLARLAPAWLLVASCALTSCRDKAQLLLPTGGPDEVPIDTTKPDEMAEGELAFGFPLPRDAKVTARMPDTVYAAGKLKFVPTANYVRERLVPKKVHSGPSKIIFELAGLKRDAKVQVQVEVIERRDDIQIIVRDRRRAAAAKVSGETEALERVGFKRDGRVIEKQAQ